MLQTNSQYEVIKGSTAGVTHTCDRVFRRGSTFKWQSFTYDPGMGTPFVWMLARCPSKGDEGVIRELYTSGGGDASDRGGHVLTGHVQKVRCMTWETDLR